MSDVRLVYICNQFDAEASIHQVDFDNDVNIAICSFEFELTSKMIHKITEKYETNDIWFVGDNMEYLKGVREQILTDHEMNYNNNELNIHIIGE